MSDDITIHVATDDDWNDMFEVMSTAFIDDIDDEVNAVERLAFEPARSVVARRDGRIVGTAGIFTRQLSVPGAVVPAAHISLVTVLPSARRRGILTRFMDHMFADAKAAGESLAVLWASEGQIYQRFGYGQAVRAVHMNASTREITFTVEVAPGRLREGTPAELRDAMVKVYDEMLVRQPGLSDRGPRHWDYRLADPPAWRRGTSAARAVVHEVDGGVDGYALWRAKGDWDARGPNGSARVMELVATNARAYVALWSFLFNIDLTRTAMSYRLAVNEPLQFMVNEPRRLGLTLGDGLWVRVLDLPAALSARRYASPVDVVLEVTDALLSENAGRWRLQGSTTSASVTATTDPADLALDIRDLGTVYLGGVPLTALASTGSVRELRAGALAEAGAAFGWPHSPAAIETF